MLAIQTKDNPDYSKYQIGEYTYGNPIIRSWGESTTLKIGKFCSIADYVSIFLGGNHRIDWVTTYPFSVIFPQFQEIQGHPMSKGDVIIGNDVWIGSEAIIMSGVTVGDGAVIGARAIVCKNVEPYSIVAGNPARKIRTRFEEGVIEKLLDLKWWDWSFDKIMEKVPLLLSDDIQGFIDSNQ